MKRTRILTHLGNVVFRVLCVVGAAAIVLTIGSACWLGFDAIEGLFR